MKKFLIVVIYFIPFFCSAQRPPITHSVYGQWPKLEFPVLTNNGQYLSYCISTVDASPKIPKRVVLVSANLKWQKELSGLGASVTFSGNSEYGFVQFSNDSLAIIKLGTDNIEWVPNISFYKTVGSNMILLRLKKKPNELLFRTLGTEKVIAFQNVEQESLSKDERYMVLVCSDKTTPQYQVSLKWIDLSSMHSVDVWKGANVSDIFWSYDQRAMVFLEGKDEKRIIWQYKVGADKPEKIIDSESIENDEYTISSVIKYSNDGSRLFITLKKKVEPKPNDDAVQVDIWTYKDSKTQTAQLNDRSNSKTQTWAYSFLTQKFTKLANSEDGGFFIRDKDNDDWAVLNGRRMVPGANVEYISSLISTISGKRISIKNGHGKISPQGKYYIYFDLNSDQFVSYEIATGVNRIITENITSTWRKNNAGYHRGEIVGWLENEEAVLLSDKFDIWAVDMAGSKPPKNLTNGYGKKNGVMLLFMLAERGDKVYIDGDEIILTAFDPKTKENGFCKIQIGKNADPEKLIMGPYAFSLAGIPNDLSHHGGFEPIKARDAEVYIIQRQSASEFPNYFITKDFKVFTRLTDLQPEKNYNWLTTELHEWKINDELTSQGILYKPQDFDSKKKYPVIFFYYIKKSDNLHVYLFPEPSNGSLNIEWYVSNGYLVFTPDIPYVKGKQYETCLSSLESAAKYLSKFPFVDAKKIGIIGHSWGGFQTNYMVTHSNMFTAACSAAGIADFVNHYNITAFGGDLRSPDYDEGRWGGPGKSIWEDPDWYLRSSPVMNADKVTTPLLMFETSVDEACPYYNGMELYYALRRLGKKVWVLEYNDGNHTVQGKSSLDFDIRLQQFFAHYLKDAPPPKWMTEGRPAYLKGIDDRLELDYSGKKP